MRKYAGLKKNDATNCLSGICVSFWVQGCPHQCPGCHNPETWNQDGGYPLSEDYKEQICEALTANNIQRNLSILGGEPLSLWNRDLIEDLLHYVRDRFPHLKIYLWTGYTIEELKAQNSKKIEYILSSIDYLIDGRYVQEERDITLFLRGSKNQRIWKKEKGEWVLDEHN